MRPIPTIAELYNDILSDLQAQFGITIPTFGKNFLRIFAGVQAAKLKLFYLGIAALQKNIFVDTADPESIGGTLERFGRVKLNRSPFPAQAGQYTVEVTGTIGATIAANTTWKSNDDSLSPGKLFIIDSAYTLAATTDVITLRALEPGTDSKLEVGNQLTATAPIALVNRIAEVTAEAVPPQAAETINEYRRKALDAYRLEPQGGAGTDYRLWAADAQGVQQVYPYAKSGVVAEINLYVEATVADSTDGKGTPSAQLLLDVEAVVEFDPDTTRPLNERGRRPLGVFQIFFLPVTIREVDIVIPNLNGRTAADEVAITAALEEAINAVRPYVAGSDILSEKNDILDTNKIIATILNTRPGSIFGSVGLTVASTPVSSYTFINGDIPHLNSVTFT
jgi:hypothetical protein